MAQFGSGKLSKVELNEAFKVLERCAIEGKRCPVTSGPDASREITASQIQKLTREKRIAVEVSGHNWRVVKLLTGPYAGMSTAANPNPNAQVYRTFNATESRVNGRLVG